MSSFNAGGLTGAVGANQANGLTFFDSKREISEGGMGWLANFFGICF